MPPQHPISRPTPPTERLPGLDTLRALAIVMVFLYHYRVFVGDAPSVGWIGEVGWIGVDLFFVLSGYLIGNQVFPALASHEPIRIRIFYLRRGLRTWPAFWCMLALYFLLHPRLGGAAPPPLWRFLTFTQNLGLRPGTAFSHAWSLCIEEQFYLVLPLVCLAFQRVRVGARGIWITLALLLALGVGARAIAWSACGLESTGRVADYYPRLYYATLCRFDEFLPGLALAVVRHFHPALWAGLLRRGRWLLAAGLSVAGLMGFMALRHPYVEGVGYAWFMSVPGYSLLAAGFALLVLAAVSPGFGLRETSLPGVRWIAIWSYSIYLSHKAVAHVVHGWTEARGWAPWSTFALIVAASVAAGAAMHHLVERPFLAWRERWR